MRPGFCRSASNGARAELERAPWGPERIAGGAGAACCRTSPRSVRMPTKAVPPPTRGAAVPSQGGRPGQRHAQRPPPRRTRSPKARPTTSGTSQLSRSPFLAEAPPHAPPGTAGMSLRPRALARLGAGAPLFGTHASLGLPTTAGPRPRRPAKSSHNGYVLLPGGVLSAPPGAPPGAPHGGASRAGRAGWRAGPANAGRAAALAIPFREETSARPAALGRGDGNGRGACAHTRAGAESEVLTDGAGRGPPRGRAPSALPRRASRQSTAGDGPRRTCCCALLPPPPRGQAGLSRTHAYPLGAAAQPAAGKDAFRRAEARERRTAVEARGPTRSRSPPRVPQPIHEFRAHVTPRGRQGGSGSSAGRARRASAKDPLVASESRPPLPASPPAAAQLPG